MTRRGLPTTTPATPAEAIVSAARQPDATSGRTRPAGDSARTKLTVQLPADLVDELRDAVVYLPTQGVQATVAAIVKQAVHRELSRLRDDHHQGQRFPARITQPRVGRPVGR